MIVNDPEILSEFTAQFEAYETALTDNDVAALDGFFWQSPLALRFGIGENLFGFDAITRFRLARHGGSPRRRLTRAVLTTYGRDFATANVEFIREGEARIGRQSQTWVRLASGWRVVAAHVSLMGSSS
ncbi:MAG: oxalurate catabolism protein HpxZ [Pseudomonadota bacterium]|nr:oxalurate catabolism protein HpxZ [Pseudomonadota bacterium]